MTEKMNVEKMNVENLENVAGGNDGIPSGYWRDVRASVATGYLALRNYPSYDERNEIAAIQNGEAFRVFTERRSGDYIWAYARGMEGWVNGNYVIYY